MFSKANKFLLTAALVSGTVMALSNPANAASNTASSAAATINQTIKEKPKGTMGSKYPQINNAMSRALLAKSTTSYTKSIPDLSEWQGSFTDAQVKAMKNQVPFVILRVQYGSNYYDKTFAHNKALVEKYNIPYGVYSFSQYSSPSDAKTEAKDLYNRAPNAKFYVNDYEDQTSSGNTNTAATNWYNTMKSYAGNRKVLLYSYASFMYSYASKAVSDYDGFWLAAYQSYEPSTVHDLWQYTDSYYLSSLNQNVDASISSNHSASWFLGSSSNDNDNNSNSGSDNNSNSGSDNNTNTGNDNNSNSGSTFVENVKYSDYSRKFIVKSNSYNFYNHVPGNNKYKTRLTNYGSTYKGKQITVNKKGILTTNNATYYRCYYNGKNIGWINAKALGPNVTYKHTSGKKTVIDSPASNFYNHVTGSQYKSIRKINNSKNYIGKTLTYDSVGTKEGWSTKYYRCYYNGKLVGWIYGGSLK